MLYFSELYKKKVFTHDGAQLGYLEDLIFSVGRIPYIKKLVLSQSRLPLQLSGRLKQVKIIQIKCLQKITDSQVIIHSNFELGQIEENELYLKRNLLDTQVIDIEENNVVRVNDVLIQHTEGKGYAIYGVDIGITGILRWFHLEESVDHVLRMFKKHTTQSTLSWSDIQPLELSSGRVKLNYRFDRIKNLHPADLADYLERQNFKNSLAILETVDKEYLAQVISELNPHFQMDILRRMNIDKIVLVISSMDPDDAVDVLANLSKGKQQDVLQRLPREESQKLKKLLELGGTSLGQFLNTDFLTVKSDDLTSEVLKKIKDKTSDFSVLEYIYVVNDNNQLIGIFNMHEFLLQNMYTPVFRFMVQSVKSAILTTPVEVAYRRMIKYKINSLPVLDKKKVILGIVSIDDLGESLLKGL